MNKELESEAEKYAHNYFEMHETNNYKALKQGFIAGVTSKYVEKQKLEFAIDVLKSVNYQPDSKFFWITDIGKKIKELEQQLNQL